MDQKRAGHEFICWPSKWKSGSEKTWNESEELTVASDDNQKKVAPSYLTF